MRGVVKMHECISMLLLLLALENVADMFLNLDIFGKVRDLLGKIPMLGGAFSCKFCMMFWMLAGALWLWMPPHMVILLFAGHRAAQVMSEFTDRYLNSRA